MSGSVNKVILIGNVGKDPEIRYLENGVIVASTTLATTDYYTDKKTNQKREITEWHNLVFWRGLGDLAKNYIKKGTKLYIEGKIRTRSYTDKENIVRYVTEIIVEEVQLLSARSTDKSKSTYPPSIETKEDLPPIENMHLDDDPLPF